MTRRFLEICVVGLFTAHCMTICVAADEAPVAAPAALTEADFLGEIPVALSASRLKQPLLDAPVSITIIDRALIKASGFIDIADLMQLVPGFQVAHANGNLAVVTYHGLADAWPRRMQILVDGRSAYVPLVSNIDFAMLGVALDDIERVEVIQGSDASAYGSNAYLAAINIITLQPFQQRGVFSQVTAGSLNTREVVARYGGAAEKFDYRVTANYRSDDGFSEVNDATRTSGINLRGVYTPNTDDTFDLQAGYHSGKLGAWGDSVSGYDKFRDKDVQGSHAALHWQHTLSDTQDLQVQFYRSTSAAQDDYPVILTEAYTKFTAGQIQTALGGRTDQAFTYYGPIDGETRRDDIEMQHTLLPNAELRFAWGGGLRSDRVRSAALFNRTDWITDQSLRLFAHSEWHMTSSLVINTGAMTEHNGMVETQTSLRVGLNYHFVEDHVLRVAVSRARRSPSIWEEHVQQASHFDDGSTLKVDVSSTGNLLPERLTSYELGYRGEMRRTHLDWDVKLYRERFRDVIEVPTDKTFPQPYEALTKKGAFVVVNTGSAALHGGEARLSYRPPYGALFSFQYNYARSDGEYLKRLHIERYGTYKLAAPMHTVSAIGGYTFSNRWQLSASIYHVDDMEWMGDGDQVDGHDRYDARIAKSFEWNYGKGEFALIGQNLADSYVDFEEHNIFERREYVQLTLQF